MQKGGSIIIERKGYQEETGEYQQYSKNRAPKIDNRLPLNSIFGRRLHDNTRHTFHT